VPLLAREFPLRTRNARTGYGVLVIWRPRRALRRKSGSRHPPLLDGLGRSVRLYERPSPGSRKRTARRRSSPGPDRAPVRRDAVCRPCRLGSYVRSAASAIATDADTPRRTRPGRLTILARHTTRPPGPGAGRRVDVALANPKRIPPAGRSSGTSSWKGDFSQTRLQAPRERRPAFK
jgi:hypothetical protein